MKVRVKVFNEEGYWLLSEIRGLKEGTIIEGRLDRNNKGVEFQWNGGDAVLWLGVNCEPVNKPHSKEKYILEIKEYLECEFYTVLWYTPDWEHCTDDRDELKPFLRHGQKPICGIEFYKTQGTDVPTDYMNGNSEIDCLRRLYKVLGLSDRSYRRKVRGYH